MIFKPSDKSCRENRAENAARLPKSALETRGFARRGFRENSRFYLRRSPVPEPSRDLRPFFRCSAQKRVRQLFGFFRSKFFAKFLFPRSEERRVGKEL